MLKTETSDLWWKSAVVYCLDIEKYFDANDDGTGDIDGLCQRIDRRKPGVCLNCPVTGLEVYLAHAVALCRAMDRQGTTCMNCDQPKGFVALAVTVIVRGATA